MVPQDRFLDIQKFAAINSVLMIYSDSKFSRVSVVTWTTKTKLACYNGLSGKLIFEEKIFFRLTSKPKWTVICWFAFTVSLTDFTLGSVGIRREANISIFHETKELEFVTDYLSTRVGDIKADVHIIVKGDLEEFYFDLQPNLKQLCPDNTTWQNQSKFCLNLAIK